MNPKRPIRVLLIEDQPGDIELARRALSDRGSGPVRFDLVHVMRLADAEEQLADVDVVLLDLVLPDARGLEALSRISRLAPELPVVVLSGRDDEGLADEAVRAGAQDYLSKDLLDAAHLGRALRFAINRMELQQLQKRLVHADRLALVGQLSAGVAHEINNPAFYVMTNLEIIDEHVTQLKRTCRWLDRLIETSPVSELRTELSGLVARAAMAQRLEDMSSMMRDSLVGMQQIRSIISSLRAFSRSDGEAIAEVRVDRILKVACEMAFNEVKHRGCLIEEIDELPPIYGDEGRLLQVFTNLLVNAAHTLDESTSSDNAIRVKARVAGSCIEVRVEDTGPGVPVPLRKRIFEPFFTTKERHSGTGLGLSLASEMVRNHGGHLELDESYTDGACFAVTIPLDTGLEAIALEAAQAREAALPVEDERGGGRVLILDDDRAICRALERILKLDHDVVTFTEPEQAVAHLEEHQHFHAILCDLMMPDIDGVGFYEMLAEAAPELCPRVIFLSGGAFTQRAREFVDELPNLVLEKPIASTELRRILSERIEDVRAQRRPGSRS